jgi:LytS/YehU family sensor histidine kinase
LEAEINCINDYIDLQKLRLSSKTTIDISIDGDYSQQQIAPMILLTFVENAFKFGISNHEASVITIRLTFSSEKMEFFCQNKNFENFERKERTGMGLANTGQRLEHLYKERYQLDTDTNDSMYTVTLTIMNGHPS